MPRDITQLSLQDLLNECPYDITIMRNKPLQRIVREYNLHRKGKPVETLPASVNICDYPRSTIVVSMSYSFPKIFFNGFRVWMWVGWNDRKQKNHTDWSIGFSPSYMRKDHTQAVYWCLEILEKTQESLSS